MPVSIGDFDLKPGGISPSVRLQTCEHNHCTLKTEQPSWEPLEDVVSAQFCSNPGAACLQWEHNQTSKAWTTWPRTFMSCSLHQTLLDRAFSPSLVSNIWWRCSSVQMSMRDFTSLLHRVYPRLILLLSLSWKYPTVQSATNVDEAVK